MKLIFLDVDGVLNHSGCTMRTPQGYYFIEEDRLALLLAIIEATGAEVVLSSSWRKGYYDHVAGHQTADAADYLLLERTLAAHGIDIIGYTPMHDTAYRGQEILAWLRAHESLDVESILILDDDKDMKPLSRFLVRTSFLHGLTEKHVKKAIDVLTNESYRAFAKAYAGAKSDVAEDDRTEHGRVRG